MDRFRMPTDAEIFGTAVLFNDCELDPIALTNMVGMCQFVLDRLYENGDILKPTKKEEEINHGI